MNTTPARSALMRRVRQSGTSPELLVRRLLREAGAGYRLNVRNLPGRPDLANRSRKKAIFVHGCFWHSHEGCGRASIPKSNREFWVTKFQANRTRDERKVDELEKMGFDVTVVWECESADTDALKNRLTTFWYS